MKLDKGFLIGSEVAYLGDGRLCVARLFEVKKEGSREHCTCCRYHWTPSHVFAMFTGVDRSGSGGRRRRVVTPDRAQVLQI
jgi:hypothetical protein